MVEVLEIYLSNIVEFEYFLESYLISIETYWLDSTGISHKGK